MSFIFATCTNFRRWIWNQFGFAWCAVVNRWNWLARSFPLCLHFYRRKPLLLIFHLLLFFLIIFLSWIHKFHKFAFRKIFLLFILKSLSFNRHLLKLFFLHRFHFRYSLASISFSVIICVLRVLSFFRNFYFY